MLGVFVGVTDYVRHLSFITSFSLCFRLAQMLDRKCDGPVPRPALSVDVSSLSPSRTPTLSLGQGRTVVRTPAQGPRYSLEAGVRVHLSSPLSSCSFHRSTSRILHQVHESCLLPPPDSLGQDTFFICHGVEHKALENTCEWNTLWRRGFPGVLSAEPLN